MCGCVFLCVQASFLTKKLNIAGRRATLSIWDTAGQERFHALGPIYYRDSNGAILVYDITDEDSFQKVGKQVVFDMRGGTGIRGLTGVLATLLQGATRSL